MWLFGRGGGGAKYSHNICGLIWDPWYKYSSLHCMQPGKCPVVLEVSTASEEGEVSSTALPVQGVLPETHTKPHSYSAGGLCFW